MLLRLGRRWRSLDVEPARVERATVEHGTAGGRATGAVVDTTGGTVLRYLVTWDARWCTRSVDVERASGPPLALVADGQGGWADAAGSLPRLDGALDVDLAGSPLTNTLPIRRLRLPVGRSADIVTAYIPDDGGPPRTSRQRYERLGAMRYRYTSLDGDQDAPFTALVDVDPVGMVERYEGLFARIP